MRRDRDLADFRRRLDGEIAGHIRSALDRPGPGETLQKYAAVVTRYAAAT